MPFTPAPPAILVYGANGHTGRFIVGELERSGFRPILAGRNRAHLETLSSFRNGGEVRVADLADPLALQRAFVGVAAVINAAGPFALTVTPLVNAAIQARVPYVDIAAETDVTAATMAEHGGRAGIAVVPAAGFFGGLGNLLATAAMEDWSQADEIVLAYSLSSWKPTAGTRATIEAGHARRGGRRLVYANHRLEMRSDQAGTTEWDFPPPVGRQIVVADFTTADCLTLSRHRQTGAITEYMTLAPLKDLADPDPAPPPAVDGRGRSAQTFLLEAVVRRDAERRTATARGTDIYAVSAPLVVEAIRRLLASPRRWHGIVTTAELGDARSYLEALAPRHLELSFDRRRD